MGRVLTNNVGLSYTIETALGVAGTSWFLLEPNAINTFGATISTVARNPISPDRQRRKGTVADLDSAIEFEHDLTLSAFRDFIEGFVFSTGTNSDATHSVTNVDGTNDEYDVSALTAAAASKLEFSTGEYASLIYARGFSTAGNNGLKQVDVDVATAATEIGVSTSVADETPPADAQVELAGFRFLDGATDVTVAYSGTTLTITVGAGIVGFDWTSFGFLTVGQMIHVGSADASGNVQNALQDSVANDTYGYARITAISATVLTCDKVDSTLQVAGPTSPATLDLMFGNFIRNVATTSSEYLERSFQFEGSFPNLDDPNDEYQYALGNYCNTVSFELPLTDKAGVSFGFIGTDTEDPVVAGSRKTGADSAENPNATDAYNTTADIARLRIQDTDETGLSTYFKSLTLTINNNVSPEKVLGTLGAAFMNTGNFDVDLTAQLIFTEGLVIDRIRANTTVSMDFVINNDDGAIAVDIPSMTMGDGSREFPVNESVLINVACQAFKDETLDTSLGISIFPSVPS